MTLNPTASSTQVSFPNGCQVYDVADPDVHGVVFAAGAEVSKIKFRDGQYRNIPNVHLRGVGATDDGLCWHNPSPDLEIVRLGQQAMARKRRVWDDWIAVAKAIQIGRAEVMRELYTNEPRGRRYEKAFGNWLVANSFKEIDKGARSRLLDCLKHIVEIEEWRAGLTDSQRFKFNHPDSVLRKWRASTVVPDPNAPPKVSAVQKLKDSLIDLQNENDRMKREIERGGGDLWCAEDRPQDIARVILSKLSKTKAEKVARELLNALKADL
jgi:hypothetical protein